MTVLAVDSAFRLEILGVGNIGINPDLDPVYGAL